MTNQDKIQATIVEKALKFYETEKSGYLDVSVRVGKIKVTIDFLKQYSKAIGDILICYPDNRILESWTNDIIKWNYSNPYITFCNFSSLKKYIDSTFDLLVIDEFQACSELERDYCHQIMTNSPSTLCLALSGTVSKETKEEWGLKEIAKYTTEEAISDGILSDYNIYVHLVDLDTKVLTPNKKGKMLSEKQKYDNYSYVITQMQRNGRNAMHLALARNRLSLSSIAKIQYTKRLLIEQLKQKRVLLFTGLAEVADEFGFSYHSKSKDDLDYKDFMNCRINHLALAAMGKMGVTFPKLDSVILLNFTYNQEESKQQLSRTLILDYAGKCADLHVICLNEPPEIKKVKETLSMLDPKKIKYI